MLLIVPMDYLAYNILYSINRFVPQMMVDILTGDTWGLRPNNQREISNRQDLFNEIQEKVFHIPQILIIDCEFLNYNPWILKRIEMNFVAYGLGDSWN